MLEVGTGLVAQAAAMTVAAADPVRAAGPPKIVVEVTGDLGKGAGLTTALVADVPSAEKDVATDPATAAGTGVKDVDTAEAAVVTTVVASGAKGVRTSVATTAGTTGGTAVGTTAATPAGRTGARAATVVMISGRGVLPEADVAKVVTGGSRARVGVTAADPTRETGGSRGVARNSARTASDAATNEMTVGTMHGATAAATVATTGVTSAAATGATTDGVPGARVVRVSGGMIVGMTGVTTEVGTAATAAVTTAGAIAATTAVASSGGRSGRTDGRRTASGTTQTVNRAWSRPNWTRT